MHKIMGFHYFDKIINFKRLKYFLIFGETLAFKFFAEKSFITSAPKITADWFISRHYRFCYLYLRVMYLKMSKDQPKNFPHSLQKVGLKKQWKQNTAAAKQHGCVQAIYLSIYIFLWYGNVKEKLLNLIICLFVVIFSTFTAEIGQ